MNGENTASLNNVAAAAKIFEKHGGFIYSVIRYKTSDKSLVDDLFQDFFLALAANSVSLEGPKLRAFLYRAIVNDIRDSVRRIERYRNLLKKYAKNREFAVNNQETKIASSVEERVEAIMKNAWDSLSPKETTAISLRYLSGHSIAEVAEKMRVKPASVSRYICIGLDKMRQSLNLSSGG
jgi:RNA polymerase sigma factor (sigma-70 family)